MKKIFFVLIAPLIISGCTLLPAEKINDDVNQNPPGSTSNPIVGENGKCGIQSCHGLDIYRGPDVPEMCTDEYRLGDFCRDFANCEIVDNECVFVETSTFDDCKTCVDDCNTMIDPIEASACEEQCRLEIMPEINDLEEENGL